MMPFIQSWAEYEHEQYAFHHFQLSWSTVFLWCFAFVNKHNEGEETAEMSVIQLKALNLPSTLLAQNSSQQSELYLHNFLILPWIKSFNLIILYSF